MGYIGIYALICIMYTLFYGVGFLEFLTDFEDKCEMTYMFEYPQFVRISQQVDENYPKYGLYAYSEGRFTSNARNMYFDGIPVLFIPGNAGSHKQVRSLSSVALRKMVNSRLPYHFDYFTVDLNNELSGLYGPLLYDQLDYVNHSLTTILQLYKSRKNKPESVVLIGHSMGGIVAMKLLSQTSNRNLIPIVINLASPLKRGVIILDYHMEKFYDNIFDNISEETTLVSLSGGSSDFLVPAYLSDTKTNHSLYAVSTNVPRAWVETNHVQIVWCKQLVLALNRALFDSVDIQTKQISRNATHRNLVFRHHLFKHSGINTRKHENYLKDVSLDYKGPWIENIKKQYTIELLHGVKENRWYMVKLDTLPGYEIVSILAINLETTDWVYICNAYVMRGPSRICVEGRHLTQFSEIAPSAKYKRRYFQTSLHELRKNHTDYTHVIFRTQPTDEPVVFHVDIQGSQERHLQVDLPEWWSVRKKVLIEKTSDNALRYELVLPELQHIVQYYYLYVEPISCKDEFYHVSASLIVPWNQESRHHFFTTTEKKPGKIRLYSSKPKNSGDQAASIRLLLEPSCSFRISMKSSIPGILGQISRTYSPLLLTNIAVIMLMSLRNQLLCLERSNRCSLLFIALKDGAKPYYVFTVVLLLSQMCGSTIRKYCPLLDIFYMIDEGTDFLLLPLLMYVSSIGVIFAIAVIFGVSLVALESSVHKLALKLLARTISFNIAWSDYVMSALHKVPVAVAVVLIFLSLSTCGGLAICLGGIFYFLRLTQMSKDFVEEVVWFFVKKFGKKLKVYLRNYFGKSKEKSKDSNLAIEGDSRSRNVTDSSNEALKKQSNVETGDKNVAEKLEKGDGDPKQALENRMNQPELNAVDQIVASGTPLPCSGEDNRQNEHTEETENIEFSSAYNSIFFHTNLFFLWCIIALINIPAVLSWAHNFKYSKVLSPDDSFIPGIVLSFCAIPLWQFEFPRTDRKWFDKLQMFVFVVAVISLLFAVISVYRLNYLLTLTILVITCQQSFAPKVGIIDSSEEDNKDEIRDKYEDVKTKME